MLERMWRPSYDSRLQEADQPKETIGKQEEVL
jgi:hypothetical protein